MYEKSDTANVSFNVINCKLQKQPLFIFFTIKIFFFKSLLKKIAIPKNYTGQDQQVEWWFKISVQLLILNNDRFIKSSKLFIQQTSPGLFWNILLSSCLLTLREASLFTAVFTAAITWSLTFVWHCFAWHHPAEEVSGCCGVFHLFISLSVQDISSKTFLILFFFFFLKLMIWCEFSSTTESSIHLFSFGVIQSFIYRLILNPCTLRWNLHYAV